MHLRCDVAKDSRLTGIQAPDFEVLHSCLVWGEAAAALDPQKQRGILDSIAQRSKEPEYNGVFKTATMCTGWEHIQTFLEASITALEDETSRSHAMITVARLWSNISSQFEENMPDFSEQAETAVKHLTAAYQEGCNESDVDFKKLRCLLTSIREGMEDTLSSSDPFALMKPHACCRSHCHVRCAQVPCIRKRTCVCISVRVHAHTRGCMCLHCAMFKVGAHASGVACTGALACAFARSSSVWRAIFCARARAHARHHACAGMSEGARCVLHVVCCMCCCVMRAVGCLCLVSSVLLLLALCCAAMRWAMMRCGALCSAMLCCACLCHGVRAPPVCHPDYTILRKPRPGGQTGRSRADPGVAPADCSKH